MNVRKKQISIITNLLSGTGIIILGIIVIVGSTNMYKTIINLCTYMFMLYGISKLLLFILNKKIVRNKQMLISIILNITFAFIMILFPKIPLSILPLLFSVYLLINSIANFIDYIILKENELKLRYKYLFLSIMFLIISFTFLFYPIEKLNLFLMIIGIYFVILGIGRIYEFIIDILSDKFKIKLKRKLKMTLPLFLEIFIPKIVLNKINKYFDLIITDDKNNEKSDLEIFIHLSNYGFNQFGHIDICYDGKIYSYGNYDNNSKKLFAAIGDGILFELTKKKKYIEFCINNNKKTIVEYGLKLTDKQKKDVEKELNKILKDSYIWKPDLKRKKDYIVKLYKNVKPKFYKFNSGEYKTYFLMGVNCTYFPKQILMNNESNILKIVGVLSPGTYYQFLEEEYRNKNSNVISKKIYNKDTIGGKYVKNKK